MKILRGEDRGQFTKDQSEASMPVEAVHFPTSGVRKVPLLGPLLHVGKGLYATFRLAENKVQKPARVLGTYIPAVQGRIESRSGRLVRREMVEALNDGG